MKNKKMIFHQDNVPCHKSLKTIAKLHDLASEFRPHPPYSPDLAPSDDWLFEDLKRNAPGKETGSIDEIIATFEGYVKVFFYVY